MRQPAVHASEIKAFLRCRLAWYWTAPKPRGLNLEPLVPRAALNFGRLIHQALQIGYDTHELFSSAFETLAEQNLEDLASTGPVFDREVEEIRKQTDLGIAMLTGYQSWAKSVDQDVRFLAMETTWDGVPLEGRMRLGGRLDAFVERSDGLWALDFKTTRYSDAKWTAQDLQATIYVYGARKLFGDKVRGLIFRFLLKKAPLAYDKLILKNGTVTSRKTIAKETTYEEYMKALAVAALKDLAQRDTDFAEQIGLGLEPSLGDFATLLDIDNLHERQWYSKFKEAFLQVRRLFYKETQDLKGRNTFFWEVPEYRTEEQLGRYMRTLIIPTARQMTSRRKDRWIGPTGLGTAFASCPNCAFRYPCKLAMDGADYRTNLLENYQQRDRSK